MGQQPETPEVVQPFIFALDPGLYPVMAGWYKENERLFSQLERAYSEVRALSDRLQDRVREEVALKPCQAVLDAYLEREGSAEQAGTVQARRAALEALRRYGRFFREVKVQIGYAGKPMSDRVRSDLKDVFEEYYSIIQPAVVIGRYECLFEEDRITIQGMTQPITSRNLYRFYTTAWKKDEAQEYASYESERPGFDPPKECHLFAATIGPGVDNEVGRLSSSGENYRALLLNGIGAGAADMVALDIELFLNGKHPSNDKQWRRFHVGYADFNIEEQKKLFALLKPDRIGIELGASCIMIPEKSVSGIVALKQVRSL